MAIIVKNAAKAAKLIINILLEGSGLSEGCPGTASLKLTTDSPPRSDAVLYLYCASIYSLLARSASCFRLSIAALLDPLELTAAFNELTLPSNELTKEELL